MEDVTAWVAVDQVRPEMGRSTPEPRVISQASRYLRVIMKTRHSFISVARHDFGCDGDDQMSVVHNIGKSEGPAPSRPISQ
jgi:hypothetical protein